jgi:hypothetical protein
VSYAFNNPGDFRGAVVFQNSALTLNVDASNQELYGPIVAAAVERQRLQDAERLWSQLPLDVGGRPMVLAASARLSARSGSL